MGVRSGRRPRRSARWSKALGPLDVRGDDLSRHPRVQRRDDGGLQVDPQERPALRAGLAPQQAAGVLGEIGMQIAGVRDADIAALRAQRGQQEIFLRFPPQVDGGLSDAGPARDRVEAEARPPGLGVQPQGRGENPALELRVPGPPGTSRGLGDDRRAHRGLPTRARPEGERGPATRAPSALKTPAFRIMRAPSAAGYRPRDTATALRATGYCAARCRSWPLASTCGPERIRWPPRGSGRSAFASPSSPWIR